MCGIINCDALHIGTPLQPSSGNYGFTEHERPLHGQTVRYANRSVGGGNACQPPGGNQEGIVADAESSGRPQGVVGKRWSPEAGSVTGLQKNLKARLESRAFYLQGDLQIRIARKQSQDQRRRTRVSVPHKSVPDKFVPDKFVQPPILPWKTTGRS